MVRFRFVQHLNINIAVIGIIRGSFSGAVERPMTLR